MGCGDRRASGRGTVLAVLALSWLAAFNTRAALLAIGPLLPLVIADLRVSATVAGSVTGLPLLLGLVSFPAGLLADRVGPRRTLVAAQAGLALAGGLRGLAESDWVLLAAAVGVGASVGFTQPPLPQVARAVSRRGVGLATSVYANGLMLGALAGLGLSVPVLLPLVGPASWRGVLLVWATAAGVCAVGWALVTVPGRTGEAATSARPMRPREVLALPGLVPLGVVFCAQVALFYSMTTWLPTYSVSRGWALAAASLPSVLLSLLSVPGSFLAPLASARLGGPRGPLLWAGALTTLSQVGLLLAPEVGLVWAMLTGIGTSFAFVLGMAAPAELAPRERVGSVAGILLAVGYLGSLLGPLGVGVLRDLTGGFSASLGFLILLAGVMWLGSAAVPTKR